MKPKASFLFTAITLVFSAVAASAAPKTWDATVNTNWDTTTANWGVGITFAAGDDAVFSSATTKSVLALPAALSAGNLFSNGANTPTTTTVNVTSGFLLTLGTGSTGSANISDLAGTGSSYLQSLTLNVNGATGGISLAAGSGTTLNPSIWNVASGKTVQVLGSSAKPLFDLNGNTVNLTGAGTVATQLTALKSTGGTGTFNVNAGTLSIRGGSSTAVTIGSDIAINVATGATLDLTTNTSGNGFSFGMTTNLNGGTLQAGSGTLTIPGPLNLVSSSTISTTNANNTVTTISGALSGAGNVSKTGIYNLILSGTNTNTGPYTVNAGVLQFGKPVSLYNNTTASWTTTNVNVKNGGTLAFSVGGTGEFTAGNITTLLGNYASSSSATDGLVPGANFGLDTTNASGGSFTLADTLIDTTGANGGARGLNKLGSNTLLVTGTNTYTGTTTVTAGTLSLGNASALGSTVAGTTVASGGALNLNGLAISGEPVTLNGTGVSSGGALINNSSTPATLSSNVTLASASSLGGTGATTLSGVISGGFTLTKLATGRQVVTGANTYTGATTVSAGVLQFGQTTSLYNNNQASWTAANLIVASGATAAFNVGGAGEFTSANLDTLRALSNVASGVTATTGFKTGSLIGLDTTNAGGSFTYGSIIANHVAGTTTDTLGVRKLGTGTLVLSGANTYTGSTFVDAGTLEVTNKGGSGVPYTIAAGATLKLGYNGPNGDSGDNITIFGNGVSDTTGLLIQGGKQTVVDGFTIKSAATTIRSYGTGTAFIKPDLNTNPYYVEAAASGSVIDSSVGIRFVNFVYGGITFKTDAGANTATGDLVVNGPITGNSNGGFPNNTLFKTSTGSLKLTAVNTFNLNGTTSVNIQDGSIILSAGDERLPAATLATLGNSTTSGRLILDGIIQTVTNVVSSGSGTTNAVVGGSPILSALNVSPATDVTLAVKVGGTGTNENNLALRKSGSGVVTLTNTANSYTGGTTVNGGILRINDSSGTVAGTGNVTVSNGGTLDGYGTLNVGVIVSSTGGTVTGGPSTGSFSGDTLTVGSLTYQGTGSLSVLPGVTQITVTNAFTTSGSANSVAVNLGTAPVALGTYTLVNHSSGPIAGTGVSAFTLGTNPGGPFTYTITDTGTELQLTVATSALIWDGANGTEWTVANNWRDSASTPITFTNGSAVVFNDGATSLSVDISTADVSPSSVTAANTFGNDYTVTGSKSIIGAASLLKGGTGTFTLNNSNSFTGNVTINQGLLDASSIADAGSASAIGSGSSIILGGGTLGYTGAAAASTNRSLSYSSPSSIQLSAGNLTLTGTVTGTSTLTKSGNSSLILDNASNTFGGNLTADGGSLVFNQPNTVSGTLSVNAGATLGIANTATLTSGTTPGTYSSAITNNGAVSVTTTANQVLGGVISGTGALTKSGSGTLTLSTNNTYTGNTTVNGGTLVAAGTNSANGSLGTCTSITVNSGGTIQVGTNDNSFVGSSSSALKTITLNQGGTITIPGNTTHHLHALVFNGGTLSATTANGTYGNWNFDRGVSTGGLGTNSAISGGNAALTQTGGTVFNIATSDTLTISSVLAKTTLAADTGLIKQGPGTLTLTGSNTYAGATTVNAGTLSGTGSATSDLNVSSGATLAPGVTIGTFVAKAVSLATGSTLAAQINTDSTTADKITATAPVNLGSATLNVTNLGSAAPASNAVFTLIDYTGATLTGNFSGLAEGATVTIGSTNYLLKYADSSKVTLTVSADPYTAWSGSYSLTGGDALRTADPDGDGLTNLQEYLFGTSPIASNGSLITSNSTGGNLTLRWLQLESGATYLVKENPTLTGTWTTVGTLPSLDSIQTGAPSGYDYYTITLPQTSSKDFFRVEATENP